MFEHTVAEGIRGVFSENEERERIDSNVQDSMIISHMIISQTNSMIMNISFTASNCDQRTAVSGYFSFILTTLSALHTSFRPLFPRNPLFPVLLTTHEQFQQPSLKKQIPSIH